MANHAINSLFIIHAPVFGGPHNTIAIMDALLKRDGVSTVVLLPSEATSAAQRLRASGVDVVTMPLHRMRAKLDPRVHANWVRTLRTEVESVVRLIQEREIDVVTTNSLPNLHGGLAARKADVACVWELIDSYPPPVVRRAYMPVVLRLADVVMSTGRKVAEQHHGTTKLGDRWVSFFPCVDTARFCFDPVQQGKARAELGLLQTAKVIGNVANLNPMKGHIHFIRAAAQLRQTHPDTQFVILGGTYDHYEEYCERLWSEAASLGLQVGRDLIVVDPEARVSELAQAFDMFWMTSEPRSEGIPTVIGEAKALGLPVVTVDVGSTAECVTNGVSGYVVPPRQPMAIAAAAARILDDDERRASMGRAARVEAVRDFAAARGADSHRTAYERALRHHASRRF